MDREDGAPRTYRERARYHRQIAAEATSADIREQWLQLALQYERLANEAEGMSRELIPRRTESRGRALISTNRRVTKLSF
jgi:hypothetical protein